MEKTILVYKLRRFQDSLYETVECFRKGQDSSGLGVFLTVINDIDDIIQACIYLEEFNIVDEILPFLRNLHEAVCNEDITGMVDLLEFSFLPFAEKALEGVNKP